MKKTILVLALLASFGVQAQEATAQSQAQSASQAGAQSGSFAGAQGNTVILDQSVPSQQSVTATYSTNGTIHQTDEVRYSGTTTVKSAPGIAMSGPASGPCTGVSGGVGLSGPGWGVGLNGSTVMVDCRLRENTRVLGMAMQSLDGDKHPAQKGELMEMFMKAARGLSAYNDKILSEEMKEAK